MTSPATPIESVPKISKRIVPALKKLGIKTVRDLLFHFPTRYDDFSNRKDIKNAAVNEIVSVTGTIFKIQAIRTARRRIIIVHATLKDATGAIRATWFNQPFLAKILKVGDRVNLAGKVALGPNGAYLQNPAYEKNQEARIKNQGLHTGGLVAIYPETRGITSRWLRFLIHFFLELRKTIPDPLPPEIKKKYLLPDTAEAIRQIHFPKNKDGAERARCRFNFEELLVFQLRALQERLRIKEKWAPAIPFDVSLIKTFVRSLPYELTDAQRRSMWEIFQDLAKPRPMNRLLEGDVGSGKTVVAAAASLLAVKNGYRVAFMAPTEILARQHFETIKKVLAPFSVKTGLLTGSTKKELNADILVGTHALFQKSAKFENLGLAVVDEQHRFGVEQRAALLKNKNYVPHFLSMSATPIPRTLALTIYGDLDLSILDEMPKFRKAVITKIVEPEKRPETYQFIRDEVNQGRQVFVICPRIETKTGHQGLTLVPRLNLDDVKAVKEEYKKLSEETFKDLRVGMLHGKLKSKEKEVVMRRFRNRDIDILVSTSVVEVGVDIANATIMIIEGAERFGLAQLHQFRGRVGRGADQSYCFLFPTEDGVVTKRLRAVVEAKNGFELAEKDLEIRGPGDFLGTRQWGVAGPLLAALADAKLVRDVRQAALDIIKKDQTLACCPALQKLVRELETEAHLE